MGALDSGTAHPIGGQGHPILITLAPFWRAAQAARPGRTDCDRRGLLWTASASYGGRVFRVSLSVTTQPVRDALRAVIAGTSGFIDAPWHLVRDGRIDLSAPSARRMAACRVEEGNGTVRMRPDQPGKRAIYARLSLSVVNGHLKRESSFIGVVPEAEWR
jgi:hypothetical protein